VDFFDRAKEEMIELSDYMFIEGWVHVGFAIGFAIFFIKTYQWNKKKEDEEDAIRAPSQFESQIGRSQVSMILAGHPNRLVHFLNEKFGKTVGFDKTAVKFGFAGMFLLVGYFIVGTYLKYTEKFVQVFDTTLNRKNFINKSTDSYSDTSAKVVAFANFLINGFWTCRLVFNQYFVLWWRGNMDASSIKQQSEELHAAVALLYIPVLLVLQIVLEAASAKTGAWLAPQIVAVVLNFVFLFRFFRTHKMYTSSQAEREKDAVMSDNIIWILLLLLLDFSTLFCLTVGALNGLNSSNVYFHSKFLQDTFMTLWIFAEALSFVMMCYLMNHKPVQIASESHVTSGKPPSGVTTDTSVQQLALAKVSSY
jgi:hypothetical protein